MSAKILLVEDEKHIAKLISYHLEKSGYNVTHKIRGDEALKLLFDENFDLVVLDLMLPGLDGLDFCRQVREHIKEPYLPIIILTAKDEEVDKIVGLEVGANDYVTKPFSPRELTARVKAQLRSKSQPPETTTNNKREQEENKSYENTKDHSDEIKVGPLHLLPKKYSAKVSGKSINLTPKEFELLKILASNPGQVFTRDILLEKVWGFDFEGDTRTVDVHIRHIRHKIQKAGYSAVIVETVRGVGYRLKEISSE